MRFLAGVFIGFLILGVIGIAAILLVEVAFDTMAEI
jgi:hypothetical protein